MFQSFLPQPFPYSPGRPDRCHLLLRVGAASKRAGIAVLLGAMATFAWAAPSTPPGAPPAPAPKVDVGASCPVPGKLTAADGSLRGFVPAHHLYLEVDGKEAPAELYHIGTTAVLVISPEFASPLLLKAHTIAAVPRAKLEKKPDGTLDIREDATLKTLGTFIPTYDTLPFNLGGHNQVVRLRPPLDFLRAPDSGTSHSPRQHTRLAPAALEHLGLCLLTSSLCVL